MVVKDSNHGFTLVELIAVIVILSVTVLGLVSLFLYTSVAGEMATNKTLAVNAAQNTMEEIRNHTFDSVAADYASGGTPGNKIVISGVPSQGVIYIDSTNSPCSTELLCVEIDISWRNKYGRIVGEDTDLDGILDAGEDVNGNAKLDSPVKLLSMITRR